MKPLELSRTFRINGYTAFCFFFFVSTERKPEQNSNGRHFFLCSLKYFTDYKLNCQSPADTVTLVLKLLSKIYNITVARFVFTDRGHRWLSFWREWRVCIYAYIHAHKVTGSLTDPREITCFVVKFTLPADLIFDLSVS